MNQLSIDYESLARDGIQRAQAHAEAVDTGWSHRAFLWLKAYCLEYRGVFTSEDFRVYAEARGFEIPVPKALGATFRKAARTGLIVKHGIGIARERHGSPTVSWRAA